MAKARQNSENQNLSSLLILPIQRIPRYKLLLTVKCLMSYVKKTKKTKKTVTSLRARLVNERLICNNKHLITITIQTQTRKY